VKIKMAHILSEPEYKKIKCNACAAIIAYLPEDYDGGTSGKEFVPCPRPKCPGEGIIYQW
jgi:hypothetical protein